MTAIVFGATAAIGALISAAGLAAAFRAVRPIATPKLPAQPAGRLVLEGTPRRRWIALLGGLGLLCLIASIGVGVLGALGLGALGASATLAPLRPWFLGLTAVFLVIGFYFAYRPVRKESCSDASCARPQSRRNQRIALWVITALAMSFATFPSWGARLTLA